MEKRNLREDHIGKLFNADGQEALIYWYTDDNGENVLLKRFKDKNCDGTPLEEVSRNKEKKLEILTSMNIDDFVPIKDALYKNGMLVGYTMPLIKGSICNLETSRKDRIEYLEKIKSIMFKFNSKGIYIGDITTNNFIITPDSNIVCLDIDNYRIKTDNETLGFDLENNNVFRFNKRCNVKDLVDRYSYNIIVLCVLGDYAEGHLNLFTLRKLPQGMNTEHNWDILEEMILIDNDYSGKLLEYKRKNN